MNPLMLIIGIVLLGASAFSGFASYSSRDENELVTIPAREVPGGPPPSSEGHDTQNAVCEHSNGWNICPPVPGANTPEFWRYYKPVLGQAIGAYEPGRSCQPFDNGYMCISTITGQVQIGLGNAGLDQLIREGFTTHSDSQTDPVVENWIQQLVAGGLRREIAVGRTISPATCQNGTCVQFFDRVKVYFPQGATSGDDVHPLPIVRSFMYPAPPPRVEPQHQEPRPLPWMKNFSLLGWGIAAAALAVAGLVVGLKGLTDEEGGDWGDK